MTELTHKKTVDMDGLRYSPYDPYCRLGPLHTCLFVRALQHTATHCNAMNTCLFVRACRLVTGTSLFLSPLNPIFYKNQIEVTQFDFLKSRLHLNFLSKNRIEPAQSDFWLFPKFTRDRLARLKCQIHTSKTPNSRANQIEPEQSRFLYGQNMNWCQSSRQMGSPLAWSMCFTALLNQENSIHGKELLLSLLDFFLFVSSLLFLAGSLRKKWEQNCCQRKLVSWWIADDFEWRAAAPGLKNPCLPRARSPGMDEGGDWWSWLRRVIAEGISRVCLRTVRNPRVLGIPTISFQPKLYS